MMHRRTVFIFFALAAFVALGVAATRAPKERNLKVLPKDISDEKLDSIMHSYNIALGEKCNFCHVPIDKNFPDSLDYASDADPMKEEARKMMRMVIHINQTNFYFDKNEKPEYLKTVTCITCHRGQPFPEH